LKPNPESVDSEGNVTPRSLGDERAREASEDIALMYEWYERVRTGIDTTNLHQQYPEVNWRRFKDWVKSQNWDAYVSSNSYSS
jgi:hypothetical protein